MRYIKRKLLIAAIVVCILAILVIVVLALRNNQLNAAAGRASALPGDADITKLPKQDSAGGDGPQTVLDPSNIDLNRTPRENEPEDTDEPAPEPVNLPEELIPSPAEERPEPTKTREEILAYYEGLFQQFWDYYTVRVSELAEQAKAEYRALPEEERTSDKKKEIVYGKIDVLTAVEAECDANVDYILSELAAELEGIGEDTSVVEEYRAEYKARKNSLQNEYIERFQNSVK